MPGPARAHAEKILRKPASREESAIRLRRASREDLDMTDSLATQFLSEAGRARVSRAVDDLRAQFGGRLSTGDGVRKQHGRGEAFPMSMLPPDAVAWPESTADVSSIVSICARHQVPVIPFGAGTSVEGHVNAPYGGVCVDLSRLNQVVAVNAQDSDCVVQSGITRETLNTYLRDTGLFFPVDPGANATIGGMLSTRASGTTTVRYGAMSQNVLALQAVLADGRVVRCGTRARKSAAGYDLVHAFIGAEGTLGIITEATLRLYGRPESIGSAICAFPTLQAAIDTVIELIQLGVPVARIEFLDEVQVRACNTHSGLTLPERPMLLMEFHGTNASVAEQTQRAQEVVTSNGGGSFESATQPEDRARLWKARHAAYFAAIALRPGCEPVVTDVCVPISALAECVTATRRDLDAAGLIAPILGHVGDGNYHTVILLDPSSGDERSRADAVYSAMIERAHRHGGTCTGEHGIGLGKRDKLVAEVGRDVIGLMRELKRAWDPLGILNPGKVLLPV